ncbi:hypothetical protein [Lactococcus lactis]|uniref:hypothetical protein n=1 Tax=Lactococcus lactis TaxID=1358 RepID=UPI002416664C|nr:hypothetical protein [Lactococcus lactis]MDG4957203.1 hypothetical protein [Lactococcus lactis]
MERDFKYLLEKYGEAGARDVFEKICVKLFQAMYGEKTKSVAVSQGDGGIDVLIGDLPSPQKVYQSKFFLDRLGSSQKQQIKKSFETATSEYDISEWCLCIPRILTEKELLWWSEWKNEKSAETGVKIDFCDGSFLINELKRYDIYEKEFDDDVRNTLNNILTELTTQRQKIYDEIIYGISTFDNLEEEYNDFVFVRMLESANILDTDDCKIEFFNAEIARQEGVSKDEVAGLQLYNNLRTKIYSIWKTQYNIHKSTNDGNILLNESYLRIEDLDSTTLASSADYNLLAKKGILHHLANEKKLGWIEDYIIKLSEYIKEY